MPISALIQHTAADVENFFLYSWEWIDCLHFLKRPEQVIPDASLCRVLVSAVEARFRKEGWEGTGTISLLWLPQFVFPGESAVPTTGMLLWHVKQHEDGISWLLSPIHLPFAQFNPMNPPRYL